VIEQRGGREQVQLIDLQQQRPVPLPGLNRADALPISVSVDARGERLALVRQLEGRSEVVLYRRSLQSLQPIAMGPGAIATVVGLRADGRQLAVQVSRDGLWQIDLVTLP
jgi:Tol biopolymer transport system component